MHTAQAHTHTFMIFRVEMERDKPYKLELLLLFFYHNN